MGRPGATARLVMWRSSSATEAARLDVVLAHSGEIPEELAIRYEKEAAHPVELDVEALYELGVGIIQTADIACASSLVRHDPARTEEALSAIFARHAALRPSPH